jgi:hypothetical protein
MIFEDRNPETVYKERIELVDEEIKELKKKDTSLSTIKLALVVAAFFFLFTFLSKDPGLAGSIFAILFILFVTAVVIHETILRKIKSRQTLKGINEREIGMLSHDFTPAAETDNEMDGTEFKNPDHGYTSDLDIFGNKSVFHYINRTVTAMGHKALAGWLQRPANPAQIKGRQDAVKELAEKLDFRQNLQKHGTAIDDTAKKLESLYGLLDDRYYILGKKAFIIFMHVLPVLTVGLFVLVYFNLPLALPLGFVFLQLLLNKMYLKKTSHVYHTASRNYKILKAYSAMIADIENEPFKAPELEDLKKELYLKERSASYYIGRLAALLQRFEVRSSDVMYFLVNGLLLWDLHCVYRIERWRVETASVVRQWFDVIGKMEALSCFANLYFNNPGWSFPRLSGGGFGVKAVSVGHPLIPTAQRVCNDIILEEGKRIMIVTGPNMAGKSTFLRTVGINIVLAMAGAPVCAAQFEISPVRLLTSMQSSDSLDRHLSLFYAELQRLKLILDGIKNQAEPDDQVFPVFFMIDEMLKGTNALDRQKGSIVLVKQLEKLTATGIVATHDLELTKLESDNGIANYHFDGYVEDDKLLFDYKLKQGICESFNAVVLMQKIGINLA